MRARRAKVDKIGRERMAMWGGGQTETHTTLYKVRLAL